MRSLRCFICVLAVASGTWSQTRAQELEPPGSRSPTTALALSALGTAVPIGLAYVVKDEGAGSALFLAGFVLGP